jgi:hypothetical protein
MTRAERERLIERYLSGAMTSTDESDFFIQVALDKELRQDLKAQRTIESAFRKDRESEPSEHTAMRSRVASSLAASSAPVNTPAPRNIADAPARASRLLRNHLMRRPVQWAVGSAAALALTIGALIFMPGERPAPPVNSSSGGQSNIPSPGLAPNGIENSSPTAPNRIGPDGAPAPDGTAGPTRSGDNAPDGMESTSYPPASVNSDGVSPGSAARAPRRSARTGSNSRAGASRALPSEPTATRQGARDGTAPSLTEPTRTADTPTRPTRKGGDSINVGARVRINPRH